MSRYNNIEKNHSKPGYNGWDLSGRRWLIKKDGHVWRARLCDDSGLNFAMHTLKQISERLNQLSKPITPPRLGAASIKVSIADKDGFRVVHGTTGETLAHVKPEHCSTDDWSFLWDAINVIVRASETRKEKVNA